MNNTFSKRIVASFIAVLMLVFTGSDSVPFMHRELRPFGKNSLVVSVL